LGEREENLTQHEEGRKRVSIFLQKEATPVEKKRMGVPAEEE